MSVVKEDRVFDALEIRDISAHTSEIIENIGFSIKTLIIENGLGKTVTFTCEGSARSDFSQAFTIATFDMPAGNNYATCESYIPYWRLKAQCAEAPSSGSLTVFLEKVTT